MASIHSPCYPICMQVTGVVADAMLLQVAPNGVPNPVPQDSKHHLHCMGYASQVSREILPMASYDDVVHNFAP